MLVKSPAQSLDPPRSLLPGLHAWLSPADHPRPADLIFVLAGHMNRKHYALQLFRDGLAPRLLFSVGRFEIRRFSKMPLPSPLDLLKLAQDVPPQQRHYFVLFQANESRVEHVQPRRFGTLTEIAALARWLAANPEVRSLLLISNDAHLRRIRLCCQSLLPFGLRLTILPVPKSFLDPEEPQPSGMQSTFSDLVELLKLLLYRLLLTVRPKPSSST
jgi:uncharacterized SAM-binding protein YcdF (DUF218 family)